MRTSLGDPPAVQKSVRYSPIVDQNVWVMYSFIDLICD